MENFDDETNDLNQNTEPEPQSGGELEPISETDVSNQNTVNQPNYSSDVIDTNSIQPGLISAVQTSEPEIPPVASVDAITPVIENTDIVTPAPIELSQPEQIGSSAPQDVQQHVAPAAVPPVTEVQPVVSQEAAPIVAANEVAVGQAPAEVIPEPVAATTPEVPAQDTALEPQQAESQTVEPAAEVESVTPEAPVATANVSKKVHPYKLVVTGVIGVMAVGVLYWVHSSFFTYSFKNYQATDTFTGTSLSDIQKASGLTAAEQIDVYRKLVKADEDAIAAGIIEHDFDANSPHFDTWDAEMKTLKEAIQRHRGAKRGAIRKEYDITFKEQQSILEKGKSQPTWQQEFENENQKAAHEQFMLGLDFYQKGTRESMIEAYTAFTTAALLDHLQADTVRQKIVDILSASEKTTAMNAATQFVATLNGEPATVVEKTVRPIPVISQPKASAPQPVVEPVPEPAPSVRTVPSWITIEAKSQKEYESSQSSEPAIQSSESSATSTEETEPTRYNPRRVRNNMDYEELWWHEEDSHNSAEEEDSPWPGEMGYNPFGAMLLFFFR